MGGCDGPILHVGATRVQIECGAAYISLEMYIILHNGVGLLQWFTNRSTWDCTAGRI